MRRKAGVERRHAHQHACVRHGLQHRIGIKPGVEQHGGPGKQYYIGRHKQSMRMVDWQGVDQHIIRCKVPEFA